VDRLVAEFHARGGQVTHCAPGNDSKADGEQAGRGVGRPSTAGSRNPANEE
jgi:hypothetical protein